MPKMFGVEEERPYAIEKDGRQLIEPVEKYGVKLLSIGFFVNPDTATLWRGSMACNAPEAANSRCRLGRIRLFYT